MKIGRPLLGLLSSAFVASAALAADLPAVPTTVAPPPPMTVPAFDWSGTYFGAYVGYAPNDPYASFGGQVGYNLVRGRLLVGAELQLGGVYAGGLGAQAALNGRLGFIIGDRLVTYAEGGVAYFWPSSIAAWTAVGGLEVAPRSSLSIFGEIGIVGSFASPFRSLLMTAGVNFHR